MQHISIKRSASADISTLDEQLLASLPYGKYHHRDDVNKAVKTICTIIMDLDKELRWIMSLLGEETKKLCDSGIAGQEQISPRDLVSIAKDRSTITEEKESTMTRKIITKKLAEMLIESSEGPARATHPLGLPKRKFNQAERQMLDDAVRTTQEASDDQQLRIELRICGVPGCPFLESIPASNMQQHLRNKHIPAGPFMVKKLNYTEWAIHLCVQAVQDRLLLIQHHFTDLPGWSPEIAKEWCLILQKKKLDEEGRQIGWMQERHVVVQTLCPVNDKGNCGLYPTANEKIAIERSLNEYLEAKRGYEQVRISESFPALGERAVDQADQDQYERLAGDQQHAQRLRPGVSVELDGQQDRQGQSNLDTSKDPPEIQASQEIEMASPDEGTTQNEMIQLIQEARKQQELVWKLLEKGFIRNLDKKQG